MSCVEYASMLTIFTDILLRTCMSEQRSRARGLQWIGVATVFMHLWALPIDLKHSAGSFSPISIDSSYSRVTQMPRRDDRAIFVTTDRQTDKTDCFTS